MNLHSIRDRTIGQDIFALIWWYASNGVDNHDTRNPYSEETRAAIARMIKLNPALERDIFNVAELAYASIEDSLMLELRIMRATIEVLSELEGQSPERIIEMAQDMIGDILQFGELGAESYYITTYCNLPSGDILGTTEKITERWRSERE